MASSIPNGTFTRTNSFAKDEDNTFARFYLDAIRNEAASAQAGREIWEDVEMIEIIFPGNPWNKPHFRVNDEIRERFPKAYAAFKASEEQRPEGRPIEEWPELTRGMVRELKSCDFHTVEQVAAMSEMAIGRIGMGARVLKEKAQAFIAEMNKMAPINALVQENDVLKSRVATAEAAAMEMKGLLDSLQAQVNEMRDRPSGVGSHVPGRFDPAQAAGYAHMDGLQAPRPTATSALDRLASKRRPPAPAPVAEAEELPASQTVRPRARGKKEPTAA